MPATESRETVIVTGASGGIGAAVVERLRVSGRRVFATMRHPDPQTHGPDAIAMDVTDDRSVDAAVQQVLERAGRIDAVVNNAGVTLVGAVEETRSDEALSVFQTNFFGVHRLCRAVLPAMRAQRRGRLVTVGSIAGFLPEPYEAFYSASKHALEGFVESLDYEVQPFGIRAVLVQPGYIRTNLGTNMVSAIDRIDVYAARRTHVAAMEAHNIGAGGSPDSVAAAVERALTHRNPPLRMLVGADARTFYLLRHVLPPAAFAMGVRRRLRAAAG